jgi:hypothetical protein
MTRARETSENARQAKAWVNFTGTGTVTRNAWFNVTSITDNNTGDYSVNFETPFVSSNNYVATVTASCEGGASAIPVVHQNGITSSSTGSLFRFRISDGNSYATQRDSTNVYVIIFGE